MTELAIRETFDNAHTAYSEARGAYDAYMAANPTKHLSFDDARPIEEKADSLCAIVFDRAIALLHTPAPDPAGIIIKSEVFTREQLRGCDDDEIGSFYLSLVDDALRLARSLPEEGAAFAQVVEQWRAARNAADGIVPGVESSDALGDVFIDADRQLIDMPALTIGDVRAKAEAIWMNDATLPTDHNLRMFFADLRRLDGHPPRTTTGADWLAFWEHHGGGWIEREGEIVLISPSNKHTAEELLWMLDIHGLMGDVMVEIRQRLSERLAA